MQYDSFETCGEKYIYAAMCLNELPSANVSGSAANVRLEQCECV